MSTALEYLETLASLKLHGSCVWSIHSFTLTDLWFNINKQNSKRQTEVDQGLAEMIPLRLQKGNFTQLYL